MRRALTRSSTARAIAPTSTPPRRNSAKGLCDTLSFKERTIMQDTTPGEAAPHAFIKSVHGVRYQVKDVARSVAFYTQRLGFKLQHQQLPAFASVTLGDAQILLSGPGASGSRPMPDGQQQEPGGWNRVVLKVADLPGFIAELRAAGLNRLASPWRAHHRRDSRCRFPRERARRRRPASRAVVRRAAGPRAGQSAAPVRAGRPT
jgi:glyoxylase I family protein